MRFLTTSRSKTVHMKKNIGKRMHPRRLSRRCCVNLNIENDSDVIDTSKRPPVSKLTTVSVLSLTIAFLSRM
ncbi:hypothetical protein Zmor_019760 [Zophobas morio]|uniref:Uncharacterized protein n=1 Tax=Zophobas morio TaxID=2755281 RepID=A0AA38I2E5_9CUCU|nr:hypothetical protein Zmor_019760 [Zophobas morio]